MEYNPVDQAQLAGRDLLVLEASPIPPLPESIQADLQERFEKELSELGFLGRIVTRREFRDEHQGSIELLRDYDQLADSVSVLGLSDREITTRLRLSEKVELLGMAQVVQLPCEFCEQGSRLGVVALLLDTESGQLRWRAHLTRKIEFQTNPEELAQEARILGDQLLVLLKRLLEPKWHRQRFEHLRKRSA